jgi:enterochelin esterase-like enzyme
LTLGTLDHNFVHTKYFQIMKSRFSLFFVGLILVCSVLHSQDSEKIKALEAQLKAAVPKMPEKDVKAFAVSMTLDEPYKLGEDSKKTEGVPEGTITKYHWVNKTIFEGTQRDYWLYVPKQYDPSKPACLMIFQDGRQYLGQTVLANVVLDNLINKGDIPVIVGLFIMYGDKGPGNDWGGSDNRNVEYESLNDLYPRFLIEEIIPELKKNYNITDDPSGRTIVGFSAGGICAFNAAWQRPDAFGKVISHCGVFANNRGGDRFPEMIRKSPKKPIRVFLQSGEGDLNVSFGNLPLRNKDMASALEYSEYDYKFVFGEGGHTLKQGGAIFPETLRWIWRDYPKN